MRERAEFQPPVQPPETEWGPHTLWIQERYPHRKLKDDEERPQVTPELEEAMDKEILTLGNLMKGWDSWWQLDGSLNISLQRGEYIGTHADVDMSILESDVVHLEVYLKERGYGLFAMTKDEDKRIFRRVGAQKFVHPDRDWHLRFGAIDENGKIRTDADLTTIDVAVTRRNARGDALGWRDVPLPEHWLKGETIDFKGVPINLSHPARFLFNKIWFMRKYDDTDLNIFAKMGALSMEDIREVGEAMRPILEYFENDPRIGKDYADLIRSRFKRVAEMVEITGRVI